MSSLFSFLIVCALLFTQPKGLLLAADNPVFKVIFETGGNIQGGIWSPDNSLFATHTLQTSRDTIPQMITIWNTKDWTIQATIENTSVDTIMENTQGFLDWSYNNQFIAAVTHDKDAFSKVVIWETSTYKTILEIDEDVQSLAFHPYRNLIAISAQNGLQLWDIEQKKQVRIFDYYCGIMTWNINGEDLACGHGEWPISVIDTYTGTITHSPVNVTVKDNPGELLKWTLDGQSLITDIGRLDTDEDLCQFKLMTIQKVERKFCKIITSRVDVNLHYDLAVVYPLFGFVESTNVSPTEVIPTEDNSLLVYSLADEKNW